jgi:hypothetical protein
MANVKISELSAVSPLSTSDELPIVDVSTGTTKKTTVSEIIGAISELPVSKLQDGNARQLLQTDAAGTGVEWTSNIDIPGTLDVTGAAVFDSSVSVTGTLTKSGSNVVTVGDTGTVTSTMLLNGTIVDGDINASAGIADTKLATISTAGKVSNSATTATNANTASAIVARDASGNFAAGTITGSLTGAASLNILRAGDAMTGALGIVPGSAGSPGLYVSGDTNTGVYSPSGDQLGLVVNGSEVARIDTSGRLLVGTSSAPFSATNLSANFGAAPTTAGAITSISIGEGARIFYGLFPSSSSAAKTCTATFQFSNTYGAAMIEIDIVGGLAQVSVGRYLLMVSCDTASGQTAQLTGGSSIQTVLASGWNAPVFTSSGASSTPTFTVAFTRATGEDTEDWTSYLTLSAKITTNSCSRACVLTTLATS